MGPAFRAFGTRGIGPLQAHHIMGNIPYLVMFEMVMKSGHSLFASVPDHVHNVVIMMSVQKVVIREIGTKGSFSPGTMAT